MSRATRRHFLRAGFALAGLGVLSGCGILPSQPRQPTKTPLIGMLVLRLRGETAHFVEAFRQGLLERGWIVGENIALDDRYADGEEDRLPELASELVRGEVDVIVAASNVANARAARQATSTIPIVMAGSSNDPVGDGLVASLSRPGGNITGLISYPPGLHAKRLQLLKETIPGASRVAVLIGPGEQARQGVRELEAAAPSLGLQLQLLEVRSPDEFESAFSAMSRGGAGALITTGSPLIYHNRARLTSHAADIGLPSMSLWREFVEAGGLMAYDTSVLSWYRQAGYYVDKILKGAKPADLPVEQPTKFDFVINLKTAQALGLTIPQSVLMQATELIQ